MYRCEEMEIKNPAKSFTDLERMILNFIWQKKKRWVAQTILCSKGTSGGITVHDFKLYYRTTIMKTSWYWHKTDIRTNGIVSKTQIKIHTPIST